MALITRLRSRAMRARTPALRAYWTRALLRAKARQGIWDERMLNGCAGNINPACRRYVMRGVAAGLVVTSTTGGRHAPTSYHYATSLRSGRAVDLGHRRPGTPAARAALVRFQRVEAARPDRYLELFGPDNAACVKDRRLITLAEGTALEDLHDDHVHGAPA